MSAYKTKVNPLTGSDYKEISQKALFLYKKIKKKTKRRPYIRSAYFDKQKIFLGLFWSHLYQKNYWDQIRRMKFFACGLDLISRSRITPTSKENVDKSEEILHRFSGITLNNEIFFVQIKESKHNGQKWLISIFPLEDAKHFNKQKKAFR